MSRIYLSVLFVCLIYTLLPAQHPGAASDSLVNWLNPVHHDFGTINQGTPVSVDFHFQNTSPYPIRIDNVRSTCGCTATQWQDAVIQPGAKSSIHIEYDALKTGYFNKKITVFFNSRRKPYKLSIAGRVR